MNKLLLLITLCVALSIQSLSQDEKDKKEITGDAAKDIFNQIGIDSLFILRGSAKNACNCIDSVDNAVKDKKKKIAAFPGCIDNEVNAYQMAVKLLRSMKNPGKNNTISIAGENSAEYRRYYYDIERWLKDSCTVLNRAISSNDEEKEKSYSNNTEAMAAYNKGVEFLKKESYAEAVPWFEKAVSIDPEFAFAWDNLGVCYRRTGKYEKAEAAYKASLKVDFTGRTALQNLPVVYLLQKKDDEAIAAYNSFLLYYPDDAEVYYGIAIVYFSNKKDMEKALDNMCKAYSIYVNQKSPFRSDAEKVINMIFTEMKKDNKEDTFNRILKENNIKPF